MSRLIRDVLILVMFCGAFYMLTMFVGADDKFSAERSNFSRDRLLADEYFDNEQWEEAIEHYDQLLLEDPFNELAIVRKARADLKVTQQRLRELKERKSSASGNQGLVERIDSEMDQTVSASVALQEEILDSHHYRILGLRNIVILHCLADDKPAAIDALKAYASEDLDTVRYSPLSADRRLRVLWEEPEYMRFYAWERGMGSFGAFR